MRKKSVRPAALVFESVRTGSFAGLFALLLTLALCLALVGCGGASQSTATQEQTQSAQEDSQEDSQENDPENSSDSDQKSETSANMLLALNFDEGEGTVIHDSFGQLPDAEVNYQFTHAVYAGNKDPEWRENGVSGGSLLFDGASTYVAYSADQIDLNQEQLTISVYLAPRAFEWDEPHAADRGDEHVTAVVSSYNKDAKQGILLGYQRFGRLCFEVGTGDAWHVLWTDDERLEKFAWNHVVASFDGVAGTMQLYLNGSEAASLDLEAGSRIAQAEKQDLLIGKNSTAEMIAAGTYNMYAGLMDELCIYACDVDTVQDEIDSLTIPDAVADEDVLLGNILTDDIYKTQYHGGPYQHWMNEPHAPIYYNGVYHLFFQSNSIGTYWRNIAWGHLVSEDMVHWRPIREALTATEDTVVPDGVWSGGATWDVNGVPVLFFTAGNDSFVEYGLISNQNIGAAIPADLEDPYLTDWIICDTLAIAQSEGQGRAGEFRDSHIFKEGDRWYMLVCSGSATSAGGSALLYYTDTLEVMPDHTIDMDWQYVGPVYEMKNQPTTYGTSWELPILLPLENASGMLRYVLMISPAPAGVADNKVYYFLGDFDAETGSFTPLPDYVDNPHLLDYGANVFTGPSVFTDPVSGQLCMFSIMQDKRSGAEEGASGWAHCVGLTRTIALNEDGTDLTMDVLDAVRDLATDNLLHLENVSLEEANEKLGSVQGDLLRIHAVLSSSDAASFGIRVRTDGGEDPDDKTEFSYNRENKTITGWTTNRPKGMSAVSLYGDLPSASDTLELEIFVDRSLVEAFFNKEKSVSVRTYADYDAQGISLFADGSLQVLELDVDAMESIYE